MAGLAKCLVKPLNQLTSGLGQTYHINLKRMKALLMHYFNLKRQSKFELSQKLFQSLWQEVVAEVWSVPKDSCKLLTLCAQPQHWTLRRVIEQLQWNGYRLIEQLYEKLFEQKTESVPIYALHAYDIQCFDKNKLNKKKQYGRAYQLGRIEGNFAIVSACTFLLSLLL